MKASVLVEGNVQGVGLRSYVIRLAQEAGLKGLVRNTSNNRVEIFLDGERSAIEQLLYKLRQRRSSSFIGMRVEKIILAYEGETTFTPAWKKYEGFEVDY